MPADPIETQLANYGKLLRSQLDQEQAAQLTTEPTTRTAAVRRRRRSSRVLMRVAAVVVPIAVLVGGLIALRREPDELIADPVESLTEIVRQETDTAVFIEALDEVDFELKATGPREPNEQERDAVVAEFNNRGHTVIEETVTIVQELDSGATVIEFDVVPTGNDDLGNGIVTDRCQTVGYKDLDGLTEIGVNGLSCFDPDYDQFTENNTEYFWSYGCQPAYPFPGGGLFGKRDFEATIGLVADSPGVIFALENGDHVLVRPTNGLAVYTGPPADQMTIYTANGEATTDRTDDCA